MKLRLIAAVLLVLALVGLLTLAGQLREKYDHVMEQYRAECLELEQKAEKLAEKQAELDKLLEAEAERQEYIDQMNGKTEELNQMRQEVEAQKAELAAQMEQLAASIEALRNEQAEDSDESYYLEVYDALTEGLNKVKEYLAAD